MDFRRCRIDFDGVCKVVGVAIMWKQKSCTRPYAVHIDLYPPSPSCLRLSCWRRNLGWFLHPCRRHGQCSLMRAMNMTRPDCQQLALEEYWSPSGKPANFFWFELSGKDLEKLNPTAKKTAIFQCEFFAVLVALNLWQKQLTNRQVVFYVDNDV